MTPNLIIRSTWLCNFRYLRNPDESPQALDYRINRKIYAQYDGAVVILLHNDGKLTMVKLKSSLL